jgi:DNA-directed RNA polymerase specialized sigma24 family protein
MTQDQVVAVITRVSNRLAGKYTFPNYEKEDIAQEAFIIGMEAMNRYDGVRPLENFLSIHIKNRLNNFKRDNYYRPDEGKAQIIQNGKKKLLDASSIDNIKYLVVNSECSESLEERELYEYIDIHLPANMRSDFLRFKNDLPLTKTKKNNLVAELRSILESFYA